MLFTPALLLLGTPEVVVEGKVRSWGKGDRSFKLSPEEILLNDPPIYLDTGE